MKKHLHIIASVESGSIAEELGLEPGDAIEAVSYTHLRAHET